VSKGVLLLCAALAWAVPAWSQGITTFYGQDQIFFTTAPTTLNAQITNASGWIVDSFTITVDGVTTTATVQNPGNGPIQGTIPWTNTAGNPSEHTVYAQAQIHYLTQSKSLDSRNVIDGAGRPADFIVSDIQLKSLQYQAAHVRGSTVLTLMQDAVVPVPVPQVTWAQGNTAVATNNPAGYVMGSRPGFAYKLYNITGGATMGLTMTATVTPFPGTDPSFTLIDTAGSPIPFTGSGITVNSPPSLLSKVYRYQMMLTHLALWVQFTQTGQTPGPWRQVTSYGSPTTLSTFFYATLTRPFTPMTNPWVPVLDDACTWAAGTADAISATTALATGLYNNGQYNGGHEQDTNQATYPETFYLYDFVYYNFAAGTPALYGQCNDFSDFLVCASSGIGATPLQSQRIGGPFQTLLTLISSTLLLEDGPITNSLA
jgi:hypothetical protein